MLHRTTFVHHGGKHYSDPIPSRYNSKYNQRGGRQNYRPESNRYRNAENDIDTLMTTTIRTLTTDENPHQKLPMNGRPQGVRRRFHSDYQTKHNQTNQMGWWRVSIQQAGTIGKERVMSTLKAHCPRQFQPYHYFIDPHTKAGVFFVNSQQDADMLKRTNGKVEVQSLDILRIMVGRVSAPISTLDEDLRPHFKDYLLRHRFNQQTFQLNLSNLADDEELSTLGIFPQLNKHAFIREVVNIINKDLHMTRQLDLGSNNIMNLYEFRNLHLNHLVQLSFASNQLKNIEDFDNLKHLSQLSHLFIKNNPLTSPNNKRNQSMDDIISNIQQKLPQLKRIDDTDLAPAIRFATDIDTITLPTALPHCVPHEMQTFLAKFIEEFYRLFDTADRNELHACYHDLCMFSLCIAKYEDSHVPTRQFKYGGLLSDSRNLQLVHDNNKRINLLRHGKTAVLEFLRTKFPLTKHDGNSFHVDVITTANNRAIFTVNGLYKEDQNKTNPIRCFQRTFTCAQTPVGVLIIADHIMLSNPTEAQILKMTTSSTASATSIHQDISNINANRQNQQMIHRFSQQSGMNIEYSTLCLQQNNWNYDKAAEVFLDLKNQNKIPTEAFNKS